MTAGDGHLTAYHIRGRNRERFIQYPVHAHEASKAIAVYILVTGVSREEFQDGFILISDPETGYALSAVSIENP